MKVASTLLAVTLSVTAVSAFGLHTGTSNVIKKMAPFHEKAMVQPVDVHGNRLSNGVVSVIDDDGCWKRLLYLSVIQDDRID